MVELPKSTPDWEMKRILSSPEIFMALLQKAVLPITLTII